MLVKKIDGVYYKMKLTELIDNMPDMELNDLHIKIIETKFNRSKKRKLQELKEIMDKLENTTFCGTETLPSHLFDDYIDDDKEPEGWYEGR